MSILVCGDIHGKTEVMNELYSLAEQPHINHLVFVGDFVDSHDRTIEEEIECMNIALDLSERGYATLIYGNHELSYLKSYMRCSRYRHEMQKYFDNNRERIVRNFVSHKYVGSILVTHAGLSLHHLEYSGAQSVMDYLLNHVERHKDIGYERGGNMPYGGIYWNDYRYEFTPVDNVLQIFGHTRRPLISEDYPGNFCIDCLDTTYQVLSVDPTTDKTATYSLEVSK